jgi:hypothetical protein
MRVPAALLSGSSKETSVSERIQNAVVGSEGLRQPRFKAALDVTMPDLLALDGAKLAKQNVDVPTMLTTALGALPEIRKYQQPCAEAYPKSDNTMFDKLEVRILALGYAYTLQKSASVPALPVQELSAKLLERRTPLEIDVGAAAARGYIDVERVNEVPNTMGYKNQAFGTLMLAALARAAWPRLQGKTAITLEELDEAEILADQLLTAVGEREQLPVVEQAAADIKARAYTLAWQTYESIRRDINHLRWYEGDADEIAPSFRAQLSKRKGSSASEEEPELSTPPLGSSNASAVIEPVTAPGSSVAPGMPGADPFIRSAS